MLKKVGYCIICLLFLSGCWSSQELDKSALVHGVGLDKSDGKLRMSVEIIKPQGGQSGTEGQEQLNGKHVILDTTEETVLENAREMIRYSKRRLHFEHSRVWIISEKLARDSFVPYLDEFRRDPMFRLNSYLFITQNNPMDILNSSTLYEELSSLELVSALAQTKYVTGYTSVKLYEFYNLTEGPIANAYIPMIKIEKKGEKKITAVNGMAVINKDRMVGLLTSNETVGLNFLIGKVKGGSLTVNVNEKDKATIELGKVKTKIEPKLIGNKLDVNVHIKVEGILADNYTKKAISKELFKKIEAKVSKKIENDVHLTLDKLQKEFQTDISGIGLETFRRYPKQWRGIKGEWNEIFSNAKIAVHIQTDITHSGLIKKSVNRNHTKPYNNPYQFK